MRAVDRIAACITVLGAEAAVGSDIVYTGAAAVQAVLTA